MFTLNQMYFMQCLSFGCGLVMGMWASYRLRKPKRDSRGRFVK